MRTKLGVAIVTLCLSLAVLGSPTKLLAQDGEALFQSFCSSCHGPEGTGGVVGRPNVGARPCSIWQAVHRFILGMEFLEVLTPQEVRAISQYLNSFELSGEDRYIVTCLGCHGKRGEGGRVAENIQGESLGEILEAIGDEDAMRYLSCVPVSDLSQIANYLDQFDD